MLYTVAVIPGKRFDLKDKTVEAIVSCILEKKDPNKVLQVIIYPIGTSEGSHVPGDSPEQLAKNFRKTAEALLKEE